MARPSTSSGWICPLPLRDTPDDRDGPRRRRRDVGRAGRAPVPARVRRRRPTPSWATPPCSTSAVRGWPSPPTRSWCSRCSSPAAASATSRSTARSTTWRCAGAHAAVPLDGVHPGGGHRARRARPGRRRRSATAARAAGVRAGHRRHQGGRRRARRRRLRQHRRHRAGRRPASTSGRDRAARRRRRHRQRRHRRARRRGDELPRGPGVRHRRSRATPRRCTGWSPRCSPPAPTCTCCATPPAAGVAASLNEIATASGVGIELVERDLPVPAEVARRLRAARARPAVRRQRGQAARVRARRTTPTRCSRRCARTRWARRAAVIGSCVDEHPGMVVARTGLGGTRVVDLPIGEQLPRIC